MAPPPPALLVITIGCATSFSLRIRSAIRRAKVSDPAPGLPGTTNSIAFSGNACASALAGASATAMHTLPRKCRLIAILSLAPREPRASRPLRHLRLERSRCRVRARNPAESRPGHHARARSIVSDPQPARHFARGIQPADRPPGDVLDLRGRGVDLEPAVGERHSATHGKTFER